MKDINLHTDDKDDYQMRLLMCHADSKMKSRDDLVTVERSQTYQKANTLTMRYHVYTVVTLVLLLIVSAFSMLTLQSVWEMRRLERTVSDLELRLVEIEAVCRTRSDNLCCDDDDDDDKDAHALSKLPLNTLEDKILQLSAGAFVDNHMESPANASDASTIGLSKSVPVYVSRHKRALDTEDKTPKKKEKKKRRGTAATFHLNMPGSDSQFYQPVNGHILSPWVDAQRKRHGTALSYKFIDDKAGITVGKKGLYFIFTQVTFHNNAPHNIAAIEVNGQTIAQCTQSTHKMKVDAASSGMFANCFTASVRYLEKNSNVSIRSLYRNRQILVRPKNTFFGLVKLA